MEYKILSAATAADLTTAINNEVANGFFVEGSVAGALVLDSFGDRNELFTVMMSKSTS